MGSTMKAMQVVAPGKFEIVELPMLEPAEDEVLIQVQACATCTNWELNTWRGRDIFDRPDYPIYPQNPGSPGHEAAGIVVGLGAQVTDLRVGDHVAVHPSLRGHENDAHATHITRPADSVAKLDPRLDFTLAAPLEMAQCAVRSLDMAGGVAGKSVAIMGLGPAGILHVQVAKAWGASKVIGLDTIPMRLEATRPYADEVVDASDEAALAKTIGEGCQIAYDCSGHPVGMRNAMEIAREAFHVFSVPHGAVEWGKREWLRSMPILPYHWRGDRQVNCLRRAVEMLAKGELDTRAIITHVLPYSRYAEGLALLESREAIKVAFSGWE